MKSATKAFLWRLSQSFWSVAIETLYHHLAVGGENLYNSYMFYEVILGKARGRGAEVLTYGSGSSLLPGQLVEVPLGREKIVGVVRKKVAQPDFATRQILQILCSTPLPRHLLRAAEFMAEYYQTPLSGVMGVMLPAGLNVRRKTGVGSSGVWKPEQNRTKPNRNVRNLAKNGQNVEQQGPDEQNDEKDTKIQQLGAKNADKISVKTEQIAENAAKMAKLPLIPLSLSQKKALEGLQKAPEATKLLLGLTGSGKTNIYLSEAARALSAQKSVIVLVPEIALTSQIVRVFRETFGDRVTLIHSAQKETERRRIFWELLEATGGACENTGSAGNASEAGQIQATTSLPPEPRIVIGPRSALFAPLHNLGLIIIDEEHESAYWQENAPKYSAIRVASYMARELKISCILGSATPNLVDFATAQKRKSLVALTEKAKKTARRPEIKLIDLKEKANFGKNRYFATALIKAMKQNLEQGRQTLIFHNRRGSAPLTICESCGEEILCPNCYLPLTLHADSYELVCHTCDYHTRVPVACPQCGAPGLVHKGFGTKLLEQELRKLLPGARIRRFDADNKRGETLAAMYEAVRAGEVDILVGTQTVAKGLDLPRLATVGIVQADAGLNLPDFAAEERSFQLLTQVMGRVGRGHIDAAEVFIQTYRPEHPIFGFAVREDFAGFAQYELARRRQAQFPPYQFVAVCSVTLKTERLVLKKVADLAVQLAKSEPDFLVSPPMPAFHERTARGYTWEIVVRARSRKRLVAALSGIDKNFRVTFDPPSLL